MSRGVDVARSAHTVVPVALPMSAVGARADSTRAFQQVAFWTRNGPSEADSGQRFGVHRTPTCPVLAFTLPGEGSDHFLSGINGAGLLSRSNGQLVALQFEKSNLVLPGQKLIPRYVDLGRKLVIVD